MIPKNEQETITLFAQLSDELGYKFKRIGTHCPDAILQKDGREFRVEFEYLASSFSKHKHDPANVDLIICWHNDWPTSPLPILELETYTVLAKPKQHIPWWKRFLEWALGFQAAIQQYRYASKISWLKNKNCLCPKCGSLMLPKCHYAKKWQDETDIHWATGYIEIKCPCCGYMEYEGLQTSTYGLVEYYFDRMNENNSRMMAVVDKVVNHGGGKGIEK